MIVELNDFFNLFTHSVHSLIRVFAGVILASIVGVLLGILRSQLPPNIKHNFLLKIILEAPKFPPPIAWIPFVILAIGIGEWSAISIVFIGAFSPIFTNTYEGVESVSKIIKNVSLSMELSRLKYMFGVLFMAALPQILSGVKIGTSIGWMSVIAAEMVAGQEGLGYSIQLNRINLQYQLMTLDMFAIGFIGYVIIELISFIEKRLLVWHEKS